jgi:hypothetical protein
VVDFDFPEDGADLLEIAAARDQLRHTSRGLCGWFAGGDEPAHSWM